MSVLIIVTLSIVGLVLLLLLFATVMKKTHHVKCDIIINAPLQKVFDYIKLLKNQEKFNKYAKEDPDRKEQLTGVDGTVGFTISWSGNKNVGEGQKEIKQIIEGKRIETEIRFVRPMTTAATIIMETEQMSNGATQLTWSNSGILKYPVNIFIPMMEAHVKNDLNTSLMELKNILEK